MFASRCRIIVKNTELLYGASLVSNHKLTFLVEDVQKSLLFFWKYVHAIYFRSTLLLDLRSIDIGGAREKKATPIIKTF